MDQWLITEEQLREMIKFGQENPDAEFYIEMLNDGDSDKDDFLSCSFWSRATEDEPDDRISGIWELSVNVTK